MPSGQREQPVNDNPANPALPLLFGLGALPLRIARIPSSSGCIFRVL